MWQVWALALRLALQRLFIEFDCRLRHIERCGGVARRGRRLGFPSYFNESAARARTHSKAQVKQLAAAIERYGFNVPIVIDETNRILAGHGRLAAARQLGMEAAPCIRIGAMSEADKKAYVIADNRIAEKAGWNRTLLAEELSFLVGESFEIELTGFSVHEVEVILADAEAAKPEGSDPEADAAPEVSPGPPVTRRGDVWALGRHRLICGDARAPDDYVDLMQGDVAARWWQSEASLAPAAPRCCLTAG